MWNASGLEAAYRDYSPKGVKFFFIYKALAHPELVDGIVQPFTLEERLAHARLAPKKLGTSIPWIVDGMDNRLKHALGNRPNSEFIIGPDGRVARKRDWSNPGEVRKDLEALIGPVERPTREEDVRLAIEPPVKGTIARGVVPRIQRPRMRALVVEPKIEANGQPFFAKLRAEADAALLDDGKGDMYLGFHLDPLHDAHWNNLTSPLKYELELPKDVKVNDPSKSAAVVKAAMDIDPREFLVKVESWDGTAPIRLTVSYNACVGDKACYAVRQEYRIHLRPDLDGGAARGEGAGFWIPEQFARQQLQRDKNGDRKLTLEEARGLIRPYFKELDTNGDGFLDFEELKMTAVWLNRHHRPGPMPKKGF